MQDSNDNLKKERASSKEALLNAAKDLFAERGYDAVSTRELAEAAGVNLAAIQYHFGSKAKLFAATVGALMKEVGGECRTLDENTPVTSQADAAVRLCVFIRGFLHYMMQTSGSKSCRIMFREIFTGTSKDPEMYETLINAVVSDFVEPTDRAVHELLKVLAPDAPDERLHYTIHSIIGQCAFYLTHRPFAERLRGYSFMGTAFFDRTVEHICRFTLQGMGFQKEFVDQALRQLSQLELKEVVACASRS